MSLAVVFEYEVDPAGAEAFEAVYGSDGEWARCFAGAEGYRRTELLRAGGGHYLVIDASGDSRRPSEPHTRP